ncbi:MAG: hypothetical protein GX977_02080 [Firmicutes bacterium]|nr:hypothetical protein [Bacillota bacterium]
MLEWEQSIFRLLNVDVDKLPEKESRELVKHLQEQMGSVYCYWVGHWNNRNRAVSTRNGRFVAN